MGDAKRHAFFSTKVVLPDLADPNAHCITPARIDIEGSRIVGVTREPSPSLAATDFGERLLAPAFVNAHTHLALTFLRGVDTRAEERLVESVFFASESKLSAEDVRAFTRMGAYEALLNGIGFVWDHYYYGTAVASALADVGLAGAVAPTLQDLGGPLPDRFELELEATLALASDETLLASGIVAALGPHATDTLSADAWRRVLDEAEKFQLPVHAHVAQSLEELERVRAREGMSCVRWLDDLGVLDRAPALVLAHGMFTTREEATMLDPSRHAFVFCPWAQRQFAFPAPIGAWTRDGVPWVVASDAPASDDALDVAAQLRACAGAWTESVARGSPYEEFYATGAVEEARKAWADRERGRANTPSPSELLARVWEAPGRLHPTCPVGRIEAGALANFAIWDLDHPAFWPARDPLRALVYGRVSGALHGMIVAGRSLGRFGEFASSLARSDAYADARAEADERLAAILGG